MGQGSRSACLHSPHGAELNILCEICLIDVQSTGRNPELGKTSLAFRWPCGKQSACQCRSCGFIPWGGKIPWRRKWQSTPVSLSGEFHGWRSLVGYSPRDCKRAGHDLATENKVHGGQIGILLPDLKGLLPPHPLSPDTDSPPPAIELSPCLAPLSYSHLPVQAKTQKRRCERLGIVQAKGI